VATLGGILFTPVEPTNFREAARCDVAKWESYWFGMLNRGVIPMGSAWFEEWSISAAHTDDDIDRTLEATGLVLRNIYAA
jgi:glutamate-1-semialdehyde 2,1-aminomutase